MSEPPPRRRAQAISRGGTGAARIAFPLAFEAAAEVSARPLDAFVSDPTQLTNGLTDLARAIGSDGIVCADRLALATLDSAVAVKAPRVAASLEACRRLRAAFAETIALVAVIDGPVTVATASGDPSAIEPAGTALAAVVRAFAEAGTDIFLIDEPKVPVDELREVARAAMTTLSRIAKFHRGIALSLASTADSPLPSPVRLPLATPEALLSGIVTTDVRVSRLDLPTMTTWLQVVRNTP